MKVIFTAIFVLGLMPTLPAPAQGQVFGEEAAPVARFSRDEITQLVGPIALYPDPLVALILPASTFPSDVVLASRFIDSGEDLAQADEKPWDSSVVGLVRYPDTLKWMDENLEWTTQLGDAYLSQPADVMDAIQQLRAQAETVGNLVDSPQQRVVADDSYIRIVPADPEYIYVPYYDPQVVYYERAVDVPLLTFSVGCEVGPWLRYDFDWHHRRLYFGEWHQGWDYRRDHGRDGHRGDDVFINRQLTNTRVWRGDPGRRLASAHFFTQTRVAHDRDRSVAQPEHFSQRSHHRDSIPRAIAVGGNGSRNASSARPSHDTNREDQNSRGRFVMPHTTKTPGSGEPGYRSSVAGGGKRADDNSRDDPRSRSHGDDHRGDVPRALPFQSDGNSHIVPGRTPHAPTIVGKTPNDAGKFRGDSKAHAQDGDASRVAAAAARTHTDMNHPHDNPTGPGRRELTPQVVPNAQQVSPTHHDVPRSSAGPSVQHNNPVITGRVDHSAPQARVAPQVQQHASQLNHQPQATARIQHSAPQDRVAPQMQHVAPQTSMPSRVQHSAPPQAHMAPREQHSAPAAQAPQGRSSSSHGSSKNSSDDDNHKRKR